MKRRPGGLAALVVMLVAGGALADEDVVRVVIEAPVGTALERSIAPGKWQLVCWAPCGTEVPRTGRHRLKGPRLRATQYVSLGAEDEVTISVPPSEIVVDRPDVDRSDPKGARSPLFVAGCVTMGVGVLVAVAGMASNVARTFPIAGEPLSSTETGMVSFGGIVAFGGMGMTIAGALSW
jgi:hypothetical protein